jgi:hypothetical protein
MYIMGIWFDEIWYTDGVRLLEDTRSCPRLPDSHSSIQAGRRTCSVESRQSDKPRLERKGVSHIEIASTLAASSGWNDTSLPLHTFLQSSRAGRRNSGLSNRPRRFRMNEERYTADGLICMRLVTCPILAEPPTLIASQTIRVNEEISDDRLIATDCMTFRTILK